MTILFQVDKFLFMDISAEIKKVTDPIYQKISNTVPEIEWTTHAPYIYKINKLKKKKECGNSCTQLSNSRNLSRYFRFFSGFIGTSS